MYQNRKILAYFFIALITILNINVYYFNNFSIGTIENNSSKVQFEIQKPALFPFIEQRSNQQISLSIFQKVTLKITFPDWSFTKTSFMEKEFASDRCYTFLCKIIIPGLEKFNIAFPFHGFW
jgi:hypothetical protein